MHRSPDGFRGRASLIASLMALQTVLQTAVRATRAGAPSSSLLSRGDGGGIGGGGAEFAQERALSMSSGELLLLRELCLAVLAGTDPFGAAAVGGSNGSNGGGIGGGKQRLGWVLRLACHRDAAVRALALGLLAEVAGLPSPSSPSSSPSVGTLPGRSLGPSAWTKETERGRGSRSPGPPGSAEERRNREDDEEIVRACVRAALDGDYESPAVVMEALRFLGRCVSAHAKGRLVCVLCAYLSTTFRLPLADLPCARVSSGGVKLASFFFLLLSRFASSRIALSGHEAAASARLFLPSSLTHSPFGPPLCTIVSTSSQCLPSIISQSILPPCCCAEPRNLKFTCLVLYPAVES